MIVDVLTHSALLNLFVAPPAGLLSVMFGAKNPKTKVSYLFFLIHILL